MGNSIRTLSPALVWTAGISMVLFFATGTAAMLGWIPAATGHSSDAPTAVSADKTAPARSVSAATARTATGTHRDAPVKTANASPVKCADCGVVESVREVEVNGTGTGLGAVGGAVVGGVLGHQVGGGRGKDVATVIGAVGGVVAGNEIEKRVRATKSYDISVRMEDGTTRVVREASVPGWRSGDRVRLVDGAIRSNA